MCTWALVGLLLLGSPVMRARAQDLALLTSLVNFGSDGLYPTGGLVLNSDGNFYGTTSSGGDANGDGTVFVVTPAGTLTTLYRFTGGADGSQPFSGLSAGPGGVLYGTTSGGGDADGDGTVFAVTSAGALTTIHTFAGSDGSQPQGGLLLGADGNFYGTTVYGGASNSGSIFRLSPTGAFATLYSFGSAGLFPTGGLVEDGQGNFYGTTSAGGDAEGDGTIFELTSSGNVTTLYTFAGTDGSQPQSGLTIGANGNLYGTTLLGGASGNGTVFEVTPAGSLTTLYSFTGGSDGAQPFAGLTLGADGNYYGTASTGGDSAGDGTIFQITPAGAFATLYTFAGSDGSQPQAALIVAGGGMLYGTTTAGGTGGAGTIFALNVTPVPSSFFTGETSLGNNVYFLAFAAGNDFGYYSFLADSRYFYHFDLGFEYVFDAADGKNGVYLYDFTSGDFFYTSPTFPFPYLYDFALETVLYYYPNTNSPGHYTTDPRYFYDYATGAIITR